MRNISKKYIVDEKNNKIAVQIDIDTFNKLEKLLEDYALGKYMKEAKNNEILTLAEAKKIYRKRKIRWAGRLVIEKDIYKYYPPA